MPDHFYAVLQPAGVLPIGKVLAFLKRVSANSMRRHGYQGRVWEERFYDRVIRSEEELSNAVTYIHENPVKAGLCDENSQWSWSTAHPSVLSDLDLVTIRWNVPTATSTAIWTPVV